MLTLAPNAVSACTWVSNGRPPITSPPGMGSRTRPIRASIGPANTNDARVRADIEHDRIDALDRAIAMVSSLPGDQAEAVMLRVVNDLAVADVAAVMGISEGNVRVLVHRGVLRLRRRLSVTDDSLLAMKRVS